MESSPDQICPVCTLYLRPGITLHDHLFTHPKDQVIEALVRVAASGSSALFSQPNNATINTNSQFTAITYRQFQTLTTSGPDSSIPMMLNPCLVTQSFNNPAPSSVIRSSAVPVVSYPYYPSDQQSTNSATDNERIENNTQCSYTYSTQTTQTTQTNSPFANNNNNFEEGECEGEQEVQEVEEVTNENYEVTIVPFVSEDLEHRERGSLREDYSANELANIEDRSFIINEIENVPSKEEENDDLDHPSQEDTHNIFDNDEIEDITETDMVSFKLMKHSERNINKNQSRLFMDSSTLEEVTEADNLMSPSHNLGTVISTTQRLIANDPSLDYDNDDIDYGEHNYNLSPGRNAVSPVSDVSNWSSGSGIRVRRDLNSVVDPNSNCVQYVQPDSNASEFVTSDPYEGQQVSETHLTNLDDKVDYSGLVLNYSTNQQMGGLSIEESKEEDSVHSTTLNIHSDEMMPPRGELSGQESLGATENSVWELQEHGEHSESNYGVFAKERWQMQDDMDDNGELTYPERSHSVKCLECDLKFSCIKERRIHVQTVHNNQRHTQVKVEDSTDRKNKFLNRLSKAEIIKIKQERFTPKTEQSNIRTCHDCGIELMTLKELRIHKKECHEIKKKCSTCDTVFDDNASYREHIAKIHPIECTVCGKFFPTKAAANTHSKSHLKLKPFQCTVCDKSFTSRIKLNEHNNIHTGETPYKCNLCDQVFRRHSNLIQHRNFFHLKIRKKIKDYFCHCGLIFHSIKKLQWHKETHEAKPKQCMYCSERYIHATSLTRHIRHTHDSAYLPKTTRSLNVLCPICKITCIRSSLATHMKIHTGEKMFTCNVCSKEFSTNWNLQMHKWTHASRSSKPFKCKQCKSAFYMLSNYQAHIRSHRNIRPYTCNYCGRQFIRKYNCVRHVKEHETNKSYCCAICNKTFHRSYYLTEHMRIHTGVKPYTCHICSKTSSTKSNHNKHVRTHHAREPVNTEG